MDSVASGDKYFNSFTLGLQLHANSDYYCIWDFLENAQNLATQV